MLRPAVVAKRRVREATKIKNCGRNRKPWGGFRKAFEGLHAARQITTFGAFAVLMDGIPTVSKALTYARSPGDSTGGLNDPGWTSSTASYDAKSFAKHSISTLARRGEVAGYRPRRLRGGHGRTEASKTRRKLMVTRTTRSLPREQRTEAARAVLRFRLPPVWPSPLTAEVPAALEPRRRFSEDFRTADPRLRPLAEVAPSSRTGRGASADMFWRARASLIARSRPYQSGRGLGPASRQRARDARRRSHRDRIRKTRGRFRANDNIAAYIETGELEQLRRRSRDKIEGVLQALVIGTTASDHNTRHRPPRGQIVTPDGGLRGRATRRTPPVTEFPNVGRLVNERDRRPDQGAGFACSTTCVCPIIGQGLVGA